jgi:F-type H+-transporting ATPase subunit c
MNATGLIAIAAALALLPCTAAAIVMGLSTGKAADATARQPEASGKIQSILVLGLALTESCAIYGFVSALIMIFTLA